MDSQAPLLMRVQDHANRFIPIWKRQMNETKSEIKYAKLKRFIDESELVLERIKTGYYQNKEWISKKPTIVRVEDAL